MQIEAYSKCIVECRLNACQFLLACILLFGHSYNVVVLPTLSGSCTLCDGDEGDEVACVALFIMYPTAEEADHYLRFAIVAVD